MTTLKVGLIGAGRMGRMYGHYLANRVPGVALAAIADRQAARARDLAAELRVAKHYGAHEELVNDREVEAVAVVTSSSAHRQVVIDAARAGKAIFCEKPISLTLEEAREMIGS